MKFGSKEIQSLCYGSKGIVKAMFGSKLIWKSVKSLISFTIDGTQYQAEEGMTWEDWVNSEYNHAYLDGFTPFTVDLIDNDYIVFTKSISGVDGSGVLHTFNKFGRKVDPVSVSEVILPKEYYLFIIFNT